MNRTVFVLLATLVLTGVSHAADFTPACHAGMLNGTYAIRYSGAGRIAPDQPLMQFRLIGTTTFDPAGATYDGGQSFDLAVSAGIGIDVVTPWEWGEGTLVIRVEGRDHIQFASPFDPANPDDGDFGLIHNAAVMIGFHSAVGLLGGGG